MHNPFIGIAPANNGTLSTYNEREVLVVANSASALTWIMPPTASLQIGDTLGVTNQLAGTLTIRNPGNTATLATITAPHVGIFMLAGDGTWEYRG